MARRVIVVSHSLFLRHADPFFLWMMEQKKKLREREREKRQVEIVHFLGKARYQRMQLRRRSFLTRASQTEKTIF